MIRLGFYTATFGIGTWLTNDFPSLSRKGEKSKALNMVIKLAGVNGKHCVKISDELMKVCLYTLSAFVFPLNFTDLLPLEHWRP